MLELSAYLEGMNFEDMDTAVVQLVFRMPACTLEVVGSAHLRRQMKAVLTPLFSQIAQLVEQRTENPRVVGSIPTQGTKVELNSAAVAVAEFFYRISGQSVVLGSLKIATEELFFRS